MKQVKPKTIRNQQSWKHNNMTSTVSQKLSFFHRTYSSYFQKIIFLSSQPMFLEFSNNF